jgi:1-acyl-sn-glycerol-3-phosphate acyltransferase
MKPLRVACRLCLSLGLFATAFLDFVFRIWLRGRASSLPLRARWLQLWAIRLLRILHVNVHYQGSPPAKGVLVSNHLSYVDVLVYGSIRPLVFLSKSEVRSWPVAGVLTRCAGTLYIRRQDRGDVARLGAEMVPVVDSGVVVALFLEGTSSGGQTVLPFRSSLLAPAQERGWPATGAFIRYEVVAGSAVEDVCYWRDMTFFPHFMNLLSKPRIDAFVVFDTTMTAMADRKKLANELHARVCGLKNLHAPTPTEVNPQPA